MQQYAKGSVTSVFEQLLHRLPTAMTHAAQALAGAQVDQEPNPSTELHFLISELERLGLPTSLV
jgi:hypothetical protein